MTCWIHPEAEAELGDAAVYYSKHASLPIAEAFIAEFERVRDLLVENPQRGPHGDRGFRVYHFDRFPYTVIYDEVPHGLQIYAVAHQHREPGYCWNARSCSASIGVWGLRGSGPIRAEHAIAVEQLPPLHADPFDRLLLAQARVEPMRLLTDVMMVV